TCQRTSHRNRSSRKAIRHKSIFSHSKIPLFEWMKFIYSYSYMFCVARFSQGLRLRQVDMMADGIAGSSTTLSKMAKKIREVCITAMEKLRRRKGQHLGGPREFVVIDESHFRHKRKIQNCIQVQNINMGEGAWQVGGKGKKWVFGMLGVRKRAGNTSKPVLRLVEHRSRAHLIPLIIHHVRTGTEVISDQWRGYQGALAHQGYNHFTVNHSDCYVDPRNGAHTQHIERAWRTYKENVWRLRGNRTEGLLEDHLNVIEWNEWLAKRHKNGSLGRLFHDISKKYK
ncbi:hypothetical protein NFI96_021306, partial [Prochilodus magdalenae]